LVIEPRTVPPPEAGLYRLGHRGQGSFEPPDWTYADPDDGTFGNRFDDPRALSLPIDKCFRIIYCASEGIGAFGETLARFRAPISLLAGLAEIHDDDEPLAESLSGALDPEYPGRMIIGADWRAQRMVSHTLLDPSLQFVDLNAAETIEHFRGPLSGAAAKLGIADIDESALLFPHREFTRPGICRDGRDRQTRRDLGHR